MTLATDGNEGKDLESCRIQDAPPSLLYIPNFITEDEEECILNKVEFTSSRE